MPAETSHAVGSLWRPTIIFLIVMSVGAALLVNERLERGPFERYTAFLTELTSRLIAVSGQEVIRNDRVLAAPDDTFAMRVDNDCNGLWAHLILLAGMLAYPATWRRRSIGILLTQPVLFGLNIIRLVSLFFVGIYLPGAFRTVHVYVWQFLIIGLAVALLLVWVDRFAQEPA